MLVFPLIGMRSTVTCLLLVLALSSAACPGGWSHWDVGNKCYRLTSGLVNAFGCATACMSLGISTTDAFQPSTLACISSSAESDFVSTLTSGLAADKSAYSNYVWIGHHQSPGSVEPVGGWDTCASGERANFTNWREGQPDDTHDDGAAGVNADGFLRWPTRAHCAVIGQPCYGCTYNMWYDRPCYLASPCLCELGSPASAEYLSSVGADIEEGLQQLRKGAAILYGAIIPALWLVPAFLRACFRLASSRICPTRDLSASSAAVMIDDSREKRTLERLEDMEKKGKRLRLRVSSTLAQLGWMLVVLGLAQTLFMVYIIDITPVAGASMCYLAAVPWGFAFQGLALRPINEGAIRIACAVGFLSFFFIGLLLAWLSVEDGSLLVTAGQALSAAACAICTVLLSTTMKMRFVCRKKEQFYAVAIRLQAIQKAKVRGEAAKGHLELLKKLKELTSEEQREQAIHLFKEYKDYLGKEHTDKDAAFEELAVHIEASQVEPGRLKAIQNTSKQTRSISGSAAKLASKLLGLFGIDANEAFLAVEAFCGRSGGGAGGEVLAIQSTLTARDITSFKDFADAFRIRVLTMVPLNLWFAFRLAIIGKVVYYRNKKSYEIMWTKPPDVEAAETGGDWMEFTLEYTMAPRRQLRRLWLVLRLFFSGGALFCFAFFISTVLYLPIDPSGPNPFALWVLLGANLLAAALVFTRANRGRVVAWLGTLGKTDDADNKAAALAALVGSLSAAKAFELGKKNFKKLDLDKLTEEDIAGRKAGTDAGDWKTSPGWPTRELYEKTTHATFGEVDAFISHSWSDDGKDKFDALKAWEKEELASRATGKDKKGVTIWLDKACLDQRDIQASLAGLPVFISGCKHLLVLAGDTYAKRLWCVIELFVFVQLGRNVKDEMIVKLLKVSDTQDKIAERLVKFDASTAETFDPNDRQRLLAVIEASFGTFNPFNKIIRATYPTAKLEARMIGDSLELTPTFKNGMDVRITSDDGSEPIFVHESGRPLIPKPTPTKVSTTRKYTLTVESPNGIKVSECVTIKTNNVVPRSGSAGSSGLGAAAAALPAGSGSGGSAAGSSAGCNLLRAAGKKVIASARIVKRFVHFNRKVLPAPAEATVEVTAAATDTKADSKDEGGREHVVTLSP